MTSSASENTRLTSKVQIRVRAFEDSDSNEIFELYKYAMFHGSASPVNQFLKHQLRKPFAFVFYALFAIGLGVGIRPPLPPTGGHLAPETARALVRAAGFITSATAAWLFFGWRRQIFRRYKMHFDTAPKGDMAEPGKHYWGINGSVTEGAKVDNPNGFWVAEIANGKDEGKIVGCVGLDVSTNPDPTSAELRRMVVSPDYQRLGIGSRLLEHLLAHARAFHDAHPGKLESIWLSTSMYQMQAMKLYERYGFSEGPKKVIGLKYLFITDKASLHFFKLKL
ncbi:hypothetical protein GALMADRAFT_247155 [Galerina marginata CBS 339.88]|uniref:N-acetyltransferase domain-containing protein n=1 Tax=Galerina marginata (strain CBS 339.88) TaxID=685588 RepID=A0A067T130_GALM3|nr:hypothetical protein GALMADRAFT_247155 [Galerina marginata CBS 339.88]